MQRTLNVFSSSWQGSILLKLTRLCRRLSLAQAEACCRPSGADPLTSPNGVPSAQFHVRHADAYSLLNDRNFTLDCAWPVDRPKAKTLGDPLNGYLSSSQVEAVFFSSVSASFFVTELWLSPARSSSQRARFEGTHDARRRRDARAFMLLNALQDGIVRSIRLLKLLRRSWLDLAVLSLVVAVVAYVRHEGA